MLETLKSDQKLLVRKARSHIKKIGSDLEPFMPQLLELLADGDYKERGELITTLADTGNWIIPHMESLLDSDDSDLVTAGRRIISRLEYKQDYEQAKDQPLTDGERLAQVIEELMDPDWTVRHGAVHMAFLLQTFDERLFEALVGCVREGIDTEEFEIAVVAPTSRNALEILGEQYLDEPSMEALLGEVLHSAPDSIGYKAAVIIAEKELACEEFYWDLKSGLSSENFYMRACSIKALALYDHPEVVDLIKPLLEDRSRCVRVEARAALNRLTGYTEPGAMSIYGMHY